MPDIIPAAVIQLEVVQTVVTQVAVISEDVDKKFCREIFISNDEIECDSWEHIFQELF
jgi:hypothetical protein